MHSNLLEILLDSELQCVIMIWSTFLKYDYSLYAAAVKWCTAKFSYFWLYWNIFNLFLFVNNWEISKKKSKFVPISVNFFKYYYWLNSWVNRSILKIKLCTRTGTFHRNEKKKQKRKQYFGKSFKKIQFDLKKEKRLITYITRKRITKW